MRGNLRNATSCISWPLSTGTSEAPAVTAGGNHQFQLGSMPATLGRYLTKVLALEILVVGNYVQSGGTGLRTFWDRLAGLIISSIDIRNSRMGTPIRQSWVLGSYLPILEYLGSGSMSRRRGALPAANATYGFAVRFTVPLCYSRDPKPQHSAPPALAYQNAQLVINYQAASVATAFSPGSSFSGLTTRVSAKLLLESEITIGPGHEWVDYTVEASAGQQLSFKAFGGATGFQGVENEAAVDTALLLTSANGLGGAFTADNVTQYGWPDRYQPMTQDIGSIVAEVFAADGDRPIGGSMAQGGTDALTDFSTFPYAQAALVSSAWVGNDPTGQTAENLATLLCIPAIYPGREVEATKLQVFPGNDTTIQLAVTGSTGTHHMLTHQRKRWTPGAMEDWKRLIIDSGAAEKVLGASARGYDWEVKLTRKQPADEIAAGKLRYLPAKLVPRAGV